MRLVMGVVTAVRGTSEGPSSDRGAAAVRTAATPSGGVHLPLLLAISLIGTSFCMEITPQVRVVSGGIWRPLQETIAYEGTIPLFFELPWPSDVNQKADINFAQGICFIDQKLCNLTNSLTDLNKIIDDQLAKVSDSIECEATTFQSREILALEIVADFLDYCCGVATNEKLKHLFVDNRQFIEQVQVLKKSLDTNFDKISHNNQKIVDFSKSVSKNFQKTSNKISELSHAFVQVQTQIKNSNEKVPHFLHELLSNYYKGQLQTIKLITLYEKMEIMSFCRQKLIPSIAIPASLLQEHLTDLKIKINSDGYDLAIPLSELSRYYKVQISECMITDSKILINIKVPIKVLNRNWELKEFIAVPAKWQNEICILLHDFSYIAVSGKTSHVISGNNLRHCRPQEDKLCYLPRGSSDSIYGADCPLLILEGASVGVLKNKCVFKCQRSDNMIITQISYDHYFITNPGKNLKVVGKTEIFSLAKFHNLPGSVEIRLPCSYKIIDEHRVIVPTLYPCDQNSVKSFSATHHLPSLWSKLPYYMPISSDTFQKETLFTNITDCLNEEWLLTAPHLNLSAPSNLPDLAPPSFKLPLEFFHPHIFSLSLDAIILILLGYIILRNPYLLGFTQARPAAAIFSHNETEFTIFTAVGASLLGVFIFFLVLIFMWVLYKKCKKSSATNEQRQGQLLKGVLVLEDNEKYEIKVLRTCKTAPENQRGESSST